MISLELNKERIIELDYFRGGIVIWVILIHSLFWTHVTSDVWKSYLLIEMPLFFFITGTSNSLGRKKSILQFYKSRLKRILIPYWTYALICLTFILLLGIDKQYNSINWFLSFPKPTSSLPYITWHLWFIPIYLLSIFLFPSLRYLYENLNETFKFLPLFILFFLIFWLDSVHWWNGNLEYFIKNTTFYSFWVYLGLFYFHFKEKAWSKPIRLMIFIESIVITYIFVHFGPYNIDMQQNKFPPNGAFLILNLGYFSLLTLISKYIFSFFQIRPLKNVILTYSKFGYSIYLFHPFGFLIVEFFLNIIKSHYGIQYHGIVFFTIYFIGVLFFGLFIPKLVGKIESLSK